MRAAKPAILMMALLWWVGAGAGEAWGARPASNANANAQAEGRKHARKANHLADINKCKQAIPEYTKALRLLKDPTLLFNRAECYRRTGEGAKAVADYRKFLLDLPNAPNRAQVETQIAALDKRPAPAATASAAPAAGSKPAPAASSKEAAGRTGATKPPVTTASPAAPPAREAPATAQVTKPVTPPVAERAPSGTEETRAIPPPPAPAEPAAPPMALVDAQPGPPAAAESEGGSSHWWIWVLGAAVIAGGAAGTYFAIKQGQTDIPASALGNYRF
jgi:hypothetical protein